MNIGKSESKFLITKNWTILTQAKTCLKFLKASQPLLMLLSAAKDQEEQLHLGAC